MAARPPPTGITLHLAPRDQWEDQSGLSEYRPEQFEVEGFIHCTDGLDRLLVPANTYCRADLRPYVALVIDLSRVTSPVRYDDGACIYPHIYGPLDTNAVIGVRPARRADDGTFVGFADVPDERGPQ